MIAYDTAVLTTRTIYLAVAVLWVFLCLVGWVIAFHAIFDLIAKLRGR